jgi:hypothetical protein
MQLVLCELNWLRIRPYTGLKISPHFTKLYIAIFMLPWRLLESPYVDLTDCGAKRWELPTCLRCFSHVLVMNHPEFPEKFISSPLTTTVGQIIYWLAQHSPDHLYNFPNTTYCLIDNIYVYGPSDNSPA